MRAALGPGLRAALALGLVAVLAGCAGDRAGTADVRLPPPGAALDYQLGGGYPPDPSVGVVVRDPSDGPVAGVYSLCYVNGFQTQPQDTQRWLDDLPELVLRDDEGAAVRDPAWPDEVLLDVSTPERRAGVLAEVAPGVRACADAGFDAVEIDNLDSFTRSGGRLDADDALALVAAYARVAHDEGLAIAQKNAPDLAADARSRAGLDLVVAEECHRWDECDAYTDVYGAAVLDVEYADDLPGGTPALCADPATPASTVVRDRDLLPAGEPGHVLERC